MNKKTVVVAGAGFAGCLLIRELSSRSPGLDVTLIDPREEAVFLPLLPDAVAGKVGIERLLFNLPDFCRRESVTFINRSAAGLSGERKLLLDDGREIPFDFLVVSAGQEPNFYGDDRARACAFTLAGQDDARRLRGRLEEVCRQGRDHTFLVVGGGYTGVETAFALVCAGRKIAGGEPPFRAGSRSAPTSACRMPATSSLSATAPPSPPGVLPRGWRFSSPGPKGSPPPATSTGGSRGIRYCPIAPAITAT